MPPPMMDSGSYASDFSHDLSPGAPRASYFPPGHALEHWPIERDMIKIEDMIERNNQNEITIVGKKEGHQINPRMTGEITSEEGVCNYLRGQKKLQCRET